ncbi:hypothetical protein EDC18_101481 [Natranaerovirga pectinivora]|uniref:Uncharacterized protein n=1 Tax=Natranaerovirga pectinivora TaxID=682400 RepID=A0A4R3MRP3_9FIRM|nr:hypothetical protein [Natranaerovirga pectinivora]TCT17183.1 hypothetical protein EDC18_101481 [Natranaerovirga pectinivora]
MEAIAFLFIGGLALFIIILLAVKMAMKEALQEFKDEIIKEFNLKKEVEDSDNSPI